MATVGNLGGYIAPITLGLVKQATGHLEYGLYTMAAAMLVGAVLMLLLPKLRSATVVATPVRRCLNHPKRSRQPDPSGWRFI